MKPSREQEILEAIDQLLAQQVSVGARFDSLFVLVETVAKSHGIELIDGLSLREWFDADRKKRMLDTLIKMGDDLGDPGYVARLTAKIKSLS